MKAISVKQPFTNLIADGHKRIETRLWNTHYRGDILICSSLTPIGYMNFVRMLPDGHGLFEWTIKTGPLGFAVAVANLWNTRPMITEDQEDACCRIYPGAWSWLLSNIRKIEPIRVKGQLRIFNTDIKPDDLVFIQ